MTTTHEPRTVDTRRPAWLLVGTLPAYVAYLALAIAFLAGKGETSAELTPAVIDDLGVAWMTVHVLWVVPTVLAAVALAMLARRLGTGGTRIVPALSAVAVALCCLYVVVNALAYGVESPTWGDSGLFAWAATSSILAGWLGVHPASLLVIVALVRAGVARRTALVVGVLYTLYVVFELLVYLPVLVGPATLAEMTGGLPPFLLGIFWAVLGGGLLRARVASA